ncbi:pentatricopeptide repeat-containing protein At3g60050-like [Solanum pennellii]|uniref:Pentatricopeptide repeat-containing protein At3g60050-like n=1 Tax=Solanum pennellii TaxID=28526 RepID=A0ABM1VFI3_SOLPN|nr:pentatricopeptide repeat-containing protein At3g60050-like [Solanum pennellii]XP_015080590.1 pentatricopeptide repeat-containing protein At3g60050-like [Solanum pennellii]XP_015080591.1 pentatricopeptide repeat-containing protein At3g60050-like [Solanum pennellii]XP_015080592.1 pentatricopeptide repeat-containing protein At3g60050-like [Solanum pennellii]XP_015080593.1 pentatricopeptide repeat-containing protein At3g60050-like [Solanum pennellii]XP_027774500.1 pentatricopeptide repeat-conta
MLSRFISKSLHLRLFTLLSPETHVLNPKSSFPHFLLNNSCFFSTGNNNGKDSDYERIDNQVLHDGSWAKEQGYKPWSFDVEGKEERLFDVGEEVNVGTEMKGFQVEEKFLQSEEKALKGSCTDEFTIKKSTKPSVSVYSEEVLEIVEIIRGGGQNLRQQLILVASKLSFKCVVEIFDLLNEQRISGLKFFNWLRDSHPEFHRSAYVNSLIICNCGWLDDYKTMFSLLEEFKTEQTCLTDKAFGFLTVFGSCKDSLMNSTKKVVDMLNEVGGSCCGSGVYGLIEMFCSLDLFEMATFVIEITERTASRYNILIRKRCRAGQIEKARAIIEEMSEFGCSPNTKSYNYLLGSLCKNDKLEDVRIVLEEMRNKGLNPDAITFETLVYHLSSRGQVEFASEFMNLMVNVNVKPRSTTHAAFLKVLLEAGEREKAYKYVIDMSAKYNHSVNTLYSLLVGLNQKKGDIMAAQNILNEMIDKGLKPDFGIFIKFVKQLGKTRRKSLARDLKMKYSVFYCSTKANNSLSNSFVP